MKAIRVHEFGSPDVMELKDVPDAVAGTPRSWGILLSNATEHDLKSIHSALFVGLENGTLRPW